MTHPGGKCMVMKYQVNHYPELVCFRKLWNLLYKHILYQK